MNTAEQLKTNASLFDLIHGLVELSEPIPNEVNVTVSGVQMDSRLLRKGDVFIALFGHNHDARDYIDDAVNIGVAAVLAESSGEWQGIRVIR
ncbi:MAG: hypothetical protein IIC60_02785, partial [Proteobacteria bacterium]|nr:hypothetical protein [Pseudomonadota bacterium]